MAQYNEQQKKSRLKLQNNKGYAALDSRMPAALKQLVKQLLLNGRFRKYILINVSPFKLFWYPF